MRRAWLAAALLFFGCGRAAPSWLEAAREANAQADAALVRGDVPSARAALVAWVGMDAPARMSREDWRPVLQDAFFRLAELDLAEDPASAARWAERGLSLGERADVFTANLLIARGHAREALGQAGAAAEDYHRALLVDEQLLRANGEAR